MSDKQYRHTPAGLALYLGAECEYEYLWWDGVHYENRQWTTRKTPLDAGDLACVNTTNHRNFTLFLRPIGSMSEEEKAAYVRRFYTKKWDRPYPEFDPFTEKDEHYTELFKLDKGRSGVRYWLRSIGIDDGGPCESSTDGGETWQEDWAESFIKVGLTKEAPCT